MNNNDRYIELVEKYFSEEISTEENLELKSILENDPGLNSDFNDQVKVKEVMKKMTLSNPKKEFWDRYWLSTVNRLDRKIAWVVILIGAIIVFSHTAYEVISKLLENTAATPLMKFGILALIIGFVLLIISLVREKIYTYKRDKYKEIQR